MGASAQLAPNVSRSLLVPVTRRFKYNRIVRAGAYKLGEALGERVLIGRTPGGSPMALSMRDHQHRFIYFHGVYEPAITALFRRLVGGDSMVFDVGANAGYFSILAAELGACVHAFEPNPRVRALLARSVSLGHADIHIVPAACSDFQGTAPLYLSGTDNTGMSSLTPQPGKHTEVKVISLDAYTARTGTRPSLIKIDVEGHEREVLAGARSLLESAKPVVVAETGGLDTVKLMRDLGYEPWRIRPDGETAIHDGRLEMMGGFENICFLPHARAAPTTRKRAAPATRAGIASATRAGIASATCAGIAPAIPVSPPASHADDAPDDR